MSERHGSMQLTRSLLRWKKLRPGNLLLHLPMQISSPAFSYFAANVTIRRKLYDTKPGWSLRVTNRNLESTTWKHSLLLFVHPHSAFYCHSPLRKVPLFINATLKMPISILDYPKTSLSIQIYPPCTHPFANSLHILKEKPTLSADGLFQSMAQNRELATGTSR